MLLLLAILCVGAAIFVLGEVATYPERLKARSVRRATDYGHIRVRSSERELMRFRERVLVPAASRLAAIPLKLSPRTSVEAIAGKLVAAGLASRLDARGFLAIKGGATIAAGLTGFVLGASGSATNALLLTPSLSV